MRVAQRMVTRNYMTSLNTAMSKRTEILNRATTGLKFNRLSQNVSDGMRAMRTQEARTSSEAQFAAVDNMLLEFNAVDSNLDSIDSILQNLQEKILRAMNDPNGETSREILAQEVTNGRDQLMQFINAKFGDDYLFSGTNNAGSAITVSNDGKLEFNGIQVDQIYKEDGVYYYDDPSKGKTVVPDSGDVYMDIGLGLKMNADEVDPRTAFKFSFSALDVFGFGAPDADGSPSNVYDALTAISNAIVSSDHDGMDRLYNKLVELNDSMRMTRADLGTRMNFLNRTKDRLEVEIDNLGEMESNLITSDLAEESMNISMAEYTWLAVLQMGSQILPASLLDYLR